jgi:hypothetical protein
MVLQSLSNFAYQLVEQSWTMATVLVKYFLLVLGAKIISEQKFELDYISDQLTEYSGELVSIVFLLGFINVFAGFSITPMFKVFSQVVAFLYFAFLFWKY